MLSETATRRNNRLPLILAFVLMLCHFAFITAFFEPAFSSPDAIGYFDQAKLIAETGKTYFETENDAQFIPQHFMSSDGEKYYSQYPPGFPAIAAVIYRLISPEASLWLNPVMASVTVLLMFFLARMWVGEWYAFLAAAMLALNPVLNEHTLVADAHTATLFFLMIALLSVTRWTRTRSPYDAALMGLCLGIIPSIRYPEVLLAPAFGFFMVLMSRDFRSERRSYVAAIAGFVVPVTLLCLRNHFAFGAFWKTGYGEIGGHISFGLKYFFTNSYQYLLQVSSEGIGVAFGLGLAGITVMCTRRDTVKQGVFLALLIVPLMLLYMFYYFPVHIASLRFMTPTFPLFIVAAVWLIREMSGGRRTTALAVTASIILVLATQSIPVSVNAMSQSSRANGSLKKIAESLRMNAKPGDIVIADSTIQQYLDFLGEWKLASAGGGMMGGRMMRMPAVNRMRTSDRSNDKTAPTGPMMRGAGRRADDSMPSNPMIRGRFRSSADRYENIINWMDEDTGIIIVCSESDLDRYEENLGEGELEILAEVDVSTVSMVINNWGGMRSNFGGMRPQPAMMGGFGGGMNSRSGRNRGPTAFRQERTDPGEARGEPGEMDGFGPGRSIGRNGNGMQDLQSEEQGTVVVIATWSPEK